MQPQNLGYLWHNYTLMESIPGMIVLICLITGFAFAIIAWRRTQALDSRKHKLETIAIKSQLTPMEIQLLDTLYDGLPEENQLSVLNDRKRFWQMLFYFSRGQVRRYPLDMVRLISKLFPVARFFFPISTLDDIQAGEVAAIIMPSVSMLARVQSVDRNKRRMLLYLSDRKMEIVAPMSTTLFIHRPKAGEARLHGTLYASPVGTAVFQLEAERIETTGQPHLMAPLAIQVVLTPIPGTMRLSGTTIASNGAATAQILDSVAPTQSLKGRTEFVSDRAITFELDPGTVLTSRDRAVDQWQMDMPVPNSNIVLKLKGRLVPSRVAEHFIFRIQNQTPEAAKILKAVVAEGAPVPERII